MIPGLVPFGTVKTTGVVSAPASLVSAVPTSGESSEPTRMLTVALAAKF